MYEVNIYVGACSASLLHSELEKFVFQLREIMGSPSIFQTALMMYPEMRQDQRAQVKPFFSWI